MKLSSVLILDHIKLKSRWYVFFVDKTVNIFAKFFYSFFYIYLNKEMHISDCYPVVLHSDVF